MFFSTRNSYLKELSAEKSTTVLRSSCAFAMLTITSEISNKHLEYPSSPLHLRIIKHSRHFVLWCFSMHTFPWCTPQQNSRYFVHWMHYIFLWFLPECWIFLSALLTKRHPKTFFCHLDKEALKHEYFICRHLTCKPCQTTSMQNNSMRPVRLMNSFVSLQFP